MQVVPWRAEPQSRVRHHAIAIGYPSKEPIRHQSSEGMFLGHRRLPSDVNEMHRLTRGVARLKMDESRR